MNIKISVIVPVHNAERHLEQALKSICAQSLKEIEIICINDGSKDKSFEILSAFEKKDKRIRLVSKIYEGYGSALNIGLNLASGEYVGIVEHTDFIDKKMYEKLYKLAKMCEADIVKSAYFEYFDKTKNSPERKQKTEWENLCKIPAWFFRVCECPSFFSFNPSIFSSIYKKTFLNNNSIRFVEARGFGFVDNPFYIESMLLAQKIIYTGSAYYFRRMQNDYTRGDDALSLFSRADEMHEILSRQKNKDKNILANIYKREFVFIQNVLRGASKDAPEADFDIKTVPYEVQLCIEKIISRMDEDIIKNNPAIDKKEKEMYNKLLQNKIKGVI